MMNTYKAKFNGAKTERGMVQRVIEYIDCNNQDEVRIELRRRGWKRIQALKIRKLEDDGNEY